MKKTVCTVMLILLLSAVNRTASAESPAGNDAFPDISGIEKIVWHCDEGKTIMAVYIKIDAWYRVTIITEGRRFVVESRADHTVHYFTGLPNDTQLQEISVEQYRTDMAIASPNHAKQLRREPNDCVKLL